MYDLNLQPKDVLTLVLSSTALVLSVANIKFNKRVKLIELKTQYLAGVQAFLAAHSEFEQARRRFRRLAEDRNDTATIAHIDSEEFTAPIAKDAQEIFDRMASLPREASLKVYEQHFHKIQAMERQAKGIASRMSMMYEDYKNDDSFKPSDKVGAA